MPTYTVDQVRSFPPDGCRYELVNGMLLVTPQPAYDHQVVATRLAAAISHYLGDEGPAVVVAPGEIEVAPSLHLEPDLLVLPERFGLDVPWTRMGGWWLAAEVFSPGSRRYDRDYKRDAYLAVGVREVWLVDLKEKCVLVSLPDGPRDARHTGALLWHPPEMAAPLVLDIPWLLRGLA